LRHFRRPLLRARGRRAVEQHRLESDAAVSRHPIAFAQSGYHFETSVLVAAQLDIADLEAILVGGDKGDFAPADLVDCGPPARPAFRVGRRRLQAMHARTFPA